MRGKAISGSFHCNRFLTVISWFCGIIEDVRMVMRMKWKMLFLLLVMIGGLLLALPVGAEDRAKIGIGKIRGWIVDPETGETVNEKFVFEVWDADDFHSYDGYLGLIYSDENGYFEDEMAENTYLLRMHTVGPSSRYAVEEPHPVKNELFRYFVKIQKGELTEIRKKATIGGRIHIQLVDLEGNLVNLKKRFNVPRLDVSVDAESPNFSPHVYLTRYDDESLLEGEFISPAIFPGEYKLQLAFTGIGHDYGWIEIDHVIVEAGKIISVAVPIDVNDQTGLEGYVYDENGTPLADARIDLVPENPLPNERVNLVAFSNQSGFFRILGFPEGKYQIVITYKSLEIMGEFIEINKGITTQKDLYFGKPN